MALTGQTGDVEDQRAVVVPYRASWPVEARHLMARLRPGFGDGVVRMDHIGSTAIPRMAAKDVIDLQVSVEDLDLTGPAGPGLEALGFTLSPIGSDHVPAGRSADAGGWSKRLWLRRQDGECSVNLHIRRAGSPNERFALLFRDWFRAHPGAVDAYGAFKLALSQVCPDVGTYADAKDPMVDVIVIAAEEWAAAVGWQI